MNSTFIFNNNWQNPEFWTHWKGEIIARDKSQFQFPWSDESWDAIDLDAHLISWLSDVESGLCAWSLWGYNKHDDSAHLFKIFVEPGQRGLGLSKLLMKQSVEVLKEKGVIDLLLEVEEFNAVAQNLYLSMNFKRLNLIPRFYRDGSSAIRMARVV